MSERPLGIIGGSGVARLAACKSEEELPLDTPFGRPSAPLQRGRVAGTPAVFLSRHGQHHALSPSEVPYRANLYALREQGVERVVSISAVGSLRADLPPGTFVLVDQFIDRSVSRPRSFFGEGCVVHVPYGDPVDAEMRATLMEAARACGENRIVDGGTYLNMEGPQFSSRAESELHRSWGCSVVGMTNGSEARLAREIGMAFVSIAMVTDFDCWHEAEAEVEVDQVLRVMADNAERVNRLLEHAAESLARLGKSPWRGVARRSLLTAEQAIPESTRQRVGRILEQW